MVAKRKRTRFAIFRGVAPHRRDEAPSPCALPLLPTEDAAQPGAVSFFAAGVDCCEPRRSFLCGDALKPSARTALVTSVASVGAGCQREGTRNKHEPVP